MDGGASTQPKRKLPWNIHLDQLVSQVTKQIRVQSECSFYGFLKAGPKSHGFLNQNSSLDSYVPYTQPSKWQMLDFFVIPQIQRFLY